MWHFGYFFVKNNIGLTKNLECFFQKLLQTIIFSIEKMSILQNKVNFEGKTNWRKSTDEFRALQFAWGSQGIVQEKGGERTIGGEANRNLPVPAAVGTREFWNSRSHWNSYRIMFLEENKEYSNGKLTWKQLLKTRDPQSKIVYLIEREKKEICPFPLSVWHNYFCGSSFEKSGWKNRIFKKCFKISYHYWENRWRWWIFGFHGAMREVSCHRSRAK